MSSFPSVYFLLPRLPQPNEGIIKKQDPCQHYGKADIGEISLTWEAPPPGNSTSFLRGTELLPQARPRHRGFKMHPYNLPSKAGGTYMGQF